MQSRVCLAPRQPEVLIATHDLTAGPIPRLLVRLASPVLIAMGLQSAYALIDLAWVGALGDKAVAGLSISLQAFFVVLAISQVIATTALAEISQAYGAGKRLEARRLLASFSVVGVVVGLASAAAAYLSTETYVGAFTADPEVYELGVDYFRVTAITFFTQLLIMIFGASVRASGDFTTPMRIMALSVVLNTALDPLLIFGLGPIPELGLSGAAWATVLSQLLALLIYCRRFATPSSDPHRLIWARPAWPRGFFQRLASRGLPAGVQFFLLSVVLGIVLASMREHGAAWTAAAGGGFRVLQQTFLPIIALASAAAAISGQNIGARKPERVAAAAMTAFRWSFYYTLAMGVILYFAAGLAAHVFARDPHELAVGAEYFRWSAPSLPAFALTYVPTFVLQAAGRAVLPLVSAVVRLVILALVVVAVLPRLDLGPGWVFGAVTATAYIEGAGAFTLLVGYLRRLKASLAPVAA